MPRDQDKTISSLRDLFPELAENELQQADQNMEEYLTLVLRVFDRTEKDSQPDPLTPGTGTLPCTPPSG